MTEIRLDRTFFKRLYNCLILGLIAAALFAAMGELSWLPDSQLLKWTASLLLIASLSMGMITLGGPYRCASCHGSLRERHHGQLVRYYCQRCNIEWVTDWQNHSD